LKSGVPPTAWRKWALALLLLVAGLALRFVVEPVLGDRYPFGTLYLVVGVVGWFMGPWPAIAVALLGFVACNALFVAPRGLVFGEGQKDMVELFFYVAICAGGLLLVRRIHQREASLRQALLEQTAVREALEASERRYRTVGEAFDFGMWSGDANGRVTFASPSLLAFVGKTLEQWADGDWRANLREPSHRVEAAIRRWRRCRRTGEDFEWEFDLAGVDGTIRTIWSRGVALRAPDGQIESWAGLNLDVSQRRQAERAHRRSREELELVTGVMTSGIVQGDREHRFVWANRTYLRWIHRGLGQLRGTPIADIVGPRGFEHLRPYLERALRGETFDVEEAVDFPTLGRRWIHASYTPMVRDGEVQGWVAVVSDVTRRHELEDELRQASRRKDEFIATLGHELRNPLAPIRYAARLFRPGTPAPVMADARRMIDRQLAHMSRLLDDLLDVSRVTRGVLELRRSSLDLRALVDSAGEAAQPLAQAAGHGIDVRLPSTPLPVDGDPTRLVQVIGNLLSNAVRFTPAGGRITVTAGLEPTAAPTVAGAIAVGASATPDPGQVVVRVRDTGIGMSAELLPRVFEPFVQGERNSGPAGGLGIGLSLARQLAQLHGGSLDASSGGAGKGSEFVLRLPLAPPSSSAVDAQAGREAIAVAATPGTAPSFTDAPGPSVPTPICRVHAKRLLVVDDNVDAADSLAQLLRLAGFDTRVAYDGRTALELAERIHPDVALLDLGLPQMSGHDLARRVRDAAWGRDVRLIAVTGWGQDDDRARSRAAGFDEHLTKPVDPEVLLGVIHRTAPPDDAASVVGG